MSKYIKKDDVLVTFSFCASIETVSLNLARQVRISCSLDDASGVNVNLRTTIEDEI
jgi:hypothetical protein